MRNIRRLQTSLSSAVRRTARASQWSEAPSPTVLFQSNENDLIHMWFESKITDATLHRLQFLIIGSLWHEIDWFYGGDGGTDDDDDANLARKFAGPSAQGRVRS